MFDLRLYRETADNSPIEDFISKLDNIQKAKVLRQFEHLCEFGVTSANPSIKKLTGTKLWEIRILGKDNLRFIVFGKENLIFVLNAFFKKSQRTPLREIKLSIIRLKNLTS